MLVSGLREETRRKFLIQKKLIQTPMLGVEPATFFLRGNIDQTRQVFIQSNHRSGPWLNFNIKSLFNCEVGPGKWQPLSG